MEEQTTLFKDFPPISTKEWEEKIREDLHGADYEKKLIWRPVEGFPVRPYYREEDLKALEYLNTRPDELPYTRAYRKDDNKWEIRQDIRVDDFRKANQKALTLLKKGITSPGFILGKASISNQDDFTVLLRTIPFESVPVHFMSDSSHMAILNKLIKTFTRLHVNPAVFRGSLNTDPLAQLAKTGRFYHDSQTDFDHLKQMIRRAGESVPNFRIISVSGDIFHNAGSSIVEELGFSLAAGNEYLARLTDQGLSVNDITPGIHFSFAAGTNYFMEIAKLRAFRTLWTAIVKAYNPDNETLCKTYIHTTTSSWNQTIFDPYINMLRGTTGAMASIIGGTDSLMVVPFDKPYRTPTEFAERISRNTQIILKEESYFDKIVDPSAGSYYIEQLTDLIAENAWKLFLEVEARGGFTEAFHQGYIQDVIEETANMRLHHIASRREILLGSNQCPNFNETMSNQIEPEFYPDIKAGVGKSRAKPLPMFRGAEEFERLRLKTERSSRKRPVVFMFTYGNLAMRRSRATFSCNFFACAGFEVVDNMGFRSIDEGLREARKGKTDIVVICSSDEEYPDIIPPVYNGLKDKSIIVVAGYPEKNMDKIKSAGIEHFIHSKSNVLEELKKFQEMLGI